MTQTHKNQDGFSAVETVLVVIVVVLIGVAGWLVYQNNHKKTETKTATTTQATPAKTATPTTDNTPKAKLVKMPELGVQFTLPAKTLTDFKYVVSNVEYPQFNNASYPTAYLGTKQLDDLGCPTTGVKGNAPALGFFTKTPGQYPTSANTDNSTGPLAKQFSDFYISYRPRGFACFESNNPQGEQLIIDGMAQIKEAAKSLELIK